jgi:uncharacterized membrane protein (UPF0127 family)
MHWRHSSGVNVLLGIVLIGTQMSMAASSSATPALLPLAFPNGTRILVEVAASVEDRARGLMFRDHLAPDRGMLFVFDEPGQWVFWMKNTKVPLDIIWLDANKRIVDIAAEVPGCVQDPCLQYQPNKDASYVLEVPAGSVKSQKLTKGMPLTFTLPKPAS